jgi:SRR1
MPDEEEWTVVTASDKKRVMRKPGRRRPRLPAGSNTHQVLDGAGIQDSDTLYTCLQDCIDYLLQTALWKHLVETLNQVVCSSSRPTTRIRQIIVYGLGNFSKTGSTYYSAPMWQLACAVSLRKHFTEQDDADAPTLVYFDPCSTCDEEAFLAEHVGCRLLSVNDQGNHPVTQETLFFMPHCPALLYECVVWSNYESGEAASIILIGNSLRCLAENGVVDCPCLQALLPLLHESELHGTANDYKEAPGNLLGAFNDTYVSHYHLSNGDGDWPKRPYDTLPQADNDPELL